VTTRVIRLGEFSPIGWFFYFGLFFQLCIEVVQIFGLHFCYLKSSCFNFDKNGVGYFLGDFFTLFIWSSWLTTDFFDWRKSFLEYIIAFWFAKKYNFFVAILSVHCLHESKRKIWPFVLCQERHITIGIMWVSPAPHFDLTTFILLKDIYYIRGRCYDH
jgi:hypothetical protein